jgi:imidazolonepropionase-like amidohydrolase
MLNSRLLILMLGFGIAIGSLGCSSHLSGSAQSSPLTAIVDATVIDGTGAQPVKDATILVRDGRISAFGPSKSVPIPTGTTVISAQGQWITPGLVDVHVHFFESGRSYSKPAIFDLTKVISFEDEWKWTKSRVPVTLGRYLCAGVTTAASMGGPRFELEVREYARSSEKSPNVFAAYGPVWMGTPSDAEGMRKAFPIFDGDDATRQVADSMAARAAVEQAASLKVDMLKAGYLGTLGRFFGVTPGSEAGFFSNVLPVLVSESRKQNLPIAAHVTELQAAKEFLRSGVDRLAHTPNDAPIDAEFVALVRQHSAIVASTLAVWTRGIDITKNSLLDVEKRCGDPQVIESWSQLRSFPPPPAPLIDSAAQTLITAEHNLKAMDEAGIQIAVGTDSGNLGLLHGASLHEEMRLMAEAGIPAMNIIVAATRNGARFINKESEFGTIGPGKLADLLILDGDPVTDIRNLSRIAKVVKSGRIYQQTTLAP